MSEEFLLGQISAISREFKSNVTESIQTWRSRSNDPNLSEKKRKKSQKLFEIWSHPYVMDILQCRHFSRNKYCRRECFLSNHGPGCKKSLLQTYKNVPRCPQGFTLPTDDHLILHMITYLDYFTAHKMTLVSKRFKGLMHTFKSMRCKEMLASMPVTLDIMDKHDFRRDQNIPELSFSKSWHPQYEQEDQDFLFDDVLKFADEKEFFVPEQRTGTPQERQSIDLRTHYARECMDIYSSFPLSTIEDMIMENDVHRNGYISLDKPQDTEEFDTYIRFKILSRHQVTLQEAWTLFVERIIYDSDENEFSEIYIPRRHLLWSLLAAADPSSIHLSHVHTTYESLSSFHLYDHIALSFIVGGERVEIVGKRKQSIIY
ncbi:predicted protein [Chaetoceros tenuissimus]|uniref:F-box domain-containing protein n=1 Tax=Chaetoceros tenuissimus TaxID=426638 RepID=A0AAD3H4E6_9STRA|nr:predicted protein [Chaetoceros tenuissimus]